MINALVRYKTCLNSRIRCFLKIQKKLLLLKSFIVAQYLNLLLFIFKPGARRDADGYLWITGRVDDMLNVSGHLMSTSEVESALTEHSRVAEAAVVSRPHPVKGECLYCFITPNVNEIFDKKMIDELKVLVREKIGAFAQRELFLKII